MDKQNRNIQSGTFERFDLLQLTKLIETCAPQPKRVFADDMVARRAHANKLRQFRDILISERPDLARSDCADVKSKSRTGRCSRAKIALTQKGLAILQATWPPDLRSPTHNTSQLTKSEFIAWAQPRGSFLNPPGPAFQAHSAAAPWGSIPIMHVRV